MDASADWTDANFAACIVGEKLSSITFVLNYLQLAIDGSCFSLFTPVSVRTANGVWKPDDPGWRDALCGRIAHIVQAVRMDDSQLWIDFDDGSAICASLRDEDYNGPEAVNFHTGETIVVI